MRRVGIFGEKGEGRAVGGGTVEWFEALSEEHLDECARLLISAFNEQPWNERRTPETARAELLWTMSTPGFFGFASFDGEMCGFAARYREQDVDREVFCLRPLCVRPGHGGWGVGSRLVKRSERTLDEIGVRLVHLITHKSGRAESFYRSNGYEIRPEDIVMVHECSRQSRGETRPRTRRCPSC